MEPKRIERRPGDRDRRRALALATAARRRLSGRREERGRVWVNGREVGSSGRFAHLDRSHD